MYIIRSLHEAESNLDLNLKLPAVLTIGNFDGIHVGHQAVLHEVVSRARNEGKSAVVITFANHPTEILRPGKPSSLLCTLDHKLLLLEKAGIDCVILLPFTKEFSEQSAELFLQRVKRALPFSTLILGSDAHLGKNREGDSQKIALLGKAMGFEAIFQPDLMMDGQRVSSSRIRTCIEQTNFQEAAKLLGRPYSVCGPVIAGTGRGKPLGFPTANLSVDKLCLPPFGVYAVTLSLDSDVFPGVANLGIAPTLHQKRQPTLETHLFDININLYDRLVDVKFENFIRPEYSFNSVEELQSQIAKDVAAARQAHHQTI